MKVHKLIPHGPMCGHLVQLDSIRVRICPWEKVDPRSLVNILCSGETSIPAAGSEYELWGFTKPCVTVPRDRLDPPET
jgi:hypothetical protein